ncbi:Rha family transcriptional regulator [Sphingomonas metalli]|uniref:Rha family transcriptional regulator n=1 Tax=Sphingomonas metalli TaxID=1779358 RepID=UPI001663FBEA|nr:Rha family transcriptional regulator [Sphingomonas metalli]
MEQGDRTIDSRDLAACFRLRHHNVLAKVDRVLQQCPAAASHIIFQKYPVKAGIGGTRYTRHAVIDAKGFMLIAMTLPSTQRELALNLLLRLLEDENT